MHQFEGKTKWHTENFKVLKLLLYMLFVQFFKKSIEN